MSKSAWVASVAKILIAPDEAPAPAGTMAAFATTLPVYEFIVDTFGIATPVGQVMKMPSCGVCGTAVKFSDYAWASGGTPQLLEGTGNERCEFARKEGGPKGVANPVPT